MFLKDSFGFTVEYRSGSWETSQEAVTVIQAREDGMEMEAHGGTGGISGEQGLEHGLEEWSERKGGFKDDANIFTLNSWQKGGAIFF